jgi:hypothetical protein
MVVLSSNPQSLASTMLLVPVMTSFGPMLRL